MKLLGKSERIALIILVVAIAFLGWSLSAGWFHMSFHYDQGYTRSHILHLDMGLLSQGSTSYLYDYDMREGVKQLGSWTIGLILLSTLLSIGYVASWLTGKTRMGTLLVGAAAVVSVVALIRYASGIADAINEDLNYPYYAPPEPLDGFFGTITTWDGYFVSYGPGSGFLIAMLAAVLQILATLLTVYREPVDKHLKRWEEKDIRDL